MLLCSLERLFPDFFKKSPNFFHLSTPKSPFEHLNKKSYFWGGCPIEATDEHSDIKMTHIIKWTTPGEPLVGFKQPWHLNSRSNKQKLSAHQ